MTVGTITQDTYNPIISAEPAVHQAESGGISAFSSVFRNTAALSSGTADLDAIFEAAGRRYNLSPNLLKAVAKVESNFRSNVVSHAGAMGIMQLMPGTANYLGVTDPFDPEQNIMGGARYLREMLDRFGGDLSVALSAYNAGPGRVSKNGGEVVPFTQNYVSKVLRNFSGGDITAGIASFGRPGSSGATGTSGDQNGLKNITDAFSQMLFIKIIEMQMSAIGSSDKDKKRVF